MAASMAQQLLRPGVLDEGLRSGLFLTGIRRTGKTTFLLNDLIPALESEGALVIYVDLWSDVRASPSDLIHHAIRESLGQLQTPASALFSKIKKVASAEVAAHGLKFNFSLDKLGDRNGTTLANALIEVVDQARAHLVLISVEADPDAQIAVIAATLRTSAADVELMRLDQLGGLATAVFDRIATSVEGTRGLFSAEAVSEYSRAVGRKAGIEEVQPAVNDLLAANLIMRRSHGVYGISDPFVQDTWLEKKRLTRIP